MSQIQINQLRDRKFAQKCCKSHCEIIHPPEGNKGWKCSKCGRKFTFHPSTFNHATWELNEAWRELIQAFANEGRRVLDKLPDWMKSSKARRP